MKSTNVMDREPAAVAAALALLVVSSVACPWKHPPADGGGGDRPVVVTPPALDAGDAGGDIMVSSRDLATGKEIPSRFTCAGANASPELSWTAGPPGTLSYAVVLTDKANGLVHWAVWDIPPFARGLPAALDADPMPANPAGARQAHASTGGPGNGYVGPCPNGVTHAYEFSVHALDVALLSSVETSSTADDARAEITAHTLRAGALSASSSAVRPVDGAAPDQGGER